MKKFLIIQTSFIGDVILATPVIEKLSKHFPDAQLDFLVRKGNHGLLENHPLLTEVLIWNKQEGKYRNLLLMLKKIQQKRYDYVINLQRFTATGFLTTRSKAKVKIGFDKNPLSFAFTHKISHEIGNGKHEVERNLELIRSITDSTPELPKLHPSDADFEKVSLFKSSPYICIAPASVWATKKLPVSKWVELVDRFSSEYNIFILGAPNDDVLGNEIINSAKNTNITNLCGSFSLLASAALMKDAVMNYSNDSAPLHLASAMNAPITAFYCSTIPEFGFGPLSSNKNIVEVKNLECRPCGLHGFEECPKGHFDCGNKIDVTKLALNFKEEA